MPSITITGSDPATGNLTLSDNGITNANRTQVVTWIIGPASGVSSITSITNKATSNDVFNPDPAKLPGASTNWQGTVNPPQTTTLPTTESYTICWNDSSGNNHCYDPQIRVNT